MRRREFIAGLGSAAAWPVMAHAQQSDRVRRVGVLMGADENDPEAKARFSDFMKELAELGWTEGRNLQVDIRRAGANADRARVYAKELVALEPDVLLAQMTGPTAALQQETKTIPIIFMGVSDPIGAAWLAGLSRPAGNITGLLNLDVSMGGKWLQLLLEIAPGIKRAAAMFHPDASTALGFSLSSYVPTGAASYYIPSFEAAARSLGVEPITAPVYNGAEMMRRASPTNPSEKQSRARWRRRRGPAPARRRALPTMARSQPRRRSLPRSTARTNGASRRSVEHHNVRTRSRMCSP